MRISNVRESKAQAEVNNLLSDATTFPLIDDNSQNATFKSSPNAVRSDVYEPFRDYGYAPAYLLDLMVTNNDPRTAVYFDADGTNGYKGVPYNVTEVDYQKGGFA